jgi:hypothetical protein
MRERPRGPALLPLVAFKGANVTHALGYAMAMLQQTPVLMQPNITIPLVAMAPANVSIELIRPGQQPQQLPMNGTPSGFKAINRVNADS